MNYTEPWWTPWNGETLIQTRRRWFHQTAGDFSIGFRTRKNRLLRCICAEGRERERERLFFSSLLLLLTVNSSFDLNKMNNVRYKWRREAEPQYLNGFREKNKTKKKKELSIRASTLLQIADSFVELPTTLFLFLSLKWGKYKKDSSDRGGRKRRRWGKKNIWWSGWILCFFFFLIRRLKRKFINVY